MPILKTISGVPGGSEPLLIQALMAKEQRPILFVTATEAKAELLTQQMRLINPQQDILYFPAWDCLPYDRISPGLDVLTQRVDILTRLLTAESPCIICSISALTQKLPPKESFQDAFLSLQPGTTLNRDSLIQFLSNKGYTRTETVREEGEFAVRGSIVDLFPTGFKEPVRLDFFGDDVESMKSFDALSQITTDTVDQITLKPVRELTLTPETISHFRISYRNLFGAVSDGLYTSISEGRRYAGMEHWLPLFFPQTETLLDYSPNALILLDHQIEEARQSRSETIRDYYMARLQPPPGDRTSPYRPIPPELLYWSEEDWATFTQHQPIINLTPFSLPDSEDLRGRLGPDFSLLRKQPDQNVFDHVRQVVQEFLSQGKQVIIACMTDGARHRLATVLADHGLKTIENLDQWPIESSPQLSLVTYPLERGFETSTLVVIGEQDILGDRMSRSVPKKRKADQFFLEASHLTTGDLIVHRDHGIGRYEGLETLTVNAVTHDCLQLTYDGGDKLYLPVENIEIISKYGTDSQVQLDRLGSIAWQTRKAKVKKRIHEIAHYLIKLAAERALHRGEIFDQLAQDRLAHEYDEFCARFPYPETDDQLRAIGEVLDDMTSGKPMDRLICGDVGFGKTEIALRAAYAAVAHGKQVAIIVPTTLLCRQHYATFSDRFRGFPYRVAQLSRFVKQRDAEQIRKDLAEGQVDIIIATHALLSDKTSFSDLGLVIVDEEQHFGVKQKEKLKQLRSDVHVLTLTATPIPRTLQLALTGVREMSLITTPPIDRLAVRTFVMPHDPVVLREAILREHYRGGQIFYVSPRLEDLARLEDQLRQLVPEIKITKAHGQMPAAHLEDVMNAFYDREYDLLLSTNIVESGIDIATANTLIIHRADMFGLAQLYQLRGRVGRSKTQGYAYLVLPQDQPISATAQKRLEIMQTLDTLGAGFTLASHDMDIRGTGNIVGEEQSGHIREVGVELYQNLLQEAILMVRAEQEMGTIPDPEWTPQINLGTSIRIPETYITDLNLRLGLYRRIAALQTRPEIDGFAAEMINRFGKFPVEVSNLLEVIEMKALCRQAGIEKLDVGTKGAVITFKGNTFANPPKLLTYIQQLKGVVKLRPDQKLVFSQPWEHASQRMKGAKKVCEILVKLAIN